MDVRVESICVRREVAASPEAVWRAFTDSAELASWYHPVGFSTQPGSIAVDAVVDGRWTAAVVVPMDGSVHWFFGRYRRVEAPNVLEYSMYYATGDAALLEEGPSHTVTVVIEELGAGSRVTYLEYGLLPVGQSALAQEGMSSYFDSLEAHLTAQAN